MEIRDGSKILSITEAGVYADLDASVYHSQLTDTPSLSSSMARTIVEECPKMIWTRSYMNPDQAREEKAVFDIGSAVHLLHLENDKFQAGIRVVTAPDWRKKEAQEARDEARAAGLIPLLQSTYDEVCAMREALEAHPIAGAAFSGEGESELSVVWKDEETGVWLKCRPDWSPVGFGFLIDLKTSTTANPRDFAKKAYGLGYHQQAAWYLDGVEAATGVRPRTMWFVVQDKSAPYLCSVVAFNPDAIDAGRQKNREAIRTFARCLERNDWPGYRQEGNPDSDSAFILTLPVWAQREVENLIAAD